MANDILIIDDQKDVLDYIEKVLRKKEYRVIKCNNAAEALGTFYEAAENLQLVILDLDLGTSVLDGLDILEKMKKASPEIPVIILTGKGSISSAIKALKLGAADFLEKDLYIEQHLEASVDKVKALLKVVEENKRLKKEREHLLKKSAFFDEALKKKYVLVGESGAMNGLRREIRQVASIPRPVLIYGERGTGKELVAANIHFSSNRSGKPFIVVNCAAFHGNLLESEMFGHERGAFSGAEERKIGRFEAADGGTLFLDEIGNMPLDFQEKILRVIEYQEFERVGGIEKIKVDVRILAATNADLEKIMQEGRFRRDLYDRLSFKVISVPPLRERKEDIDLLVRHFQEVLRQELPWLGEKEVTGEALSKLKEHSWPGNIRELRNTIERLTALSDKKRIEASDIVLRKYAEDEGKTFDEKVEFFKKRLISQALAQAGGSQKKASEVLGITYDQFRHYYRKFVKS